MLKIKKLNKVKNNHKQKRKLQYKNNINCIANEIDETLERNETSFYENLTQREEICKKLLFRTRNAYHGGTYIDINKIGMFLLNIELLRVNRKNRRLGEW